MKPVPAIVCSAPMNERDLDAALAHQEALILAAEGRIEVDEMEIGRALRAIRDHELFRVTHPTFESYAKALTGRSARRVAELILSSEVADRLKETSGKGVAPTKEETVKQLLKSGFSDAEIDLAWRMCLAQSGGTEPDAKQITLAIRTMKESTGPSVDPHDTDAVDSAIDELAEVPGTLGEPPWEDEEGEPDPPIPTPQEPQKRRTVLDCPRVQGPKLSAAPIDAALQYEGSKGEDTVEGATEDWISLLPAREKLSSTCRTIFDAAARAWADCESERKGMRAKLAPLHKQAGPKDRWVEDVWATLQLPAPASWRACLSCTDRSSGYATGLNPRTGQTCEACGGTGYHQR
jgi:hypothetical protein